MCACACARVRVCACARVHVCIRVCVPMTDSRLLKVVSYGELAKGKRIDGGRRLRVKDNSQKTPEGYTHCRKHLGDSSTTSTTVEAGHSQRIEPY